jgi:hypothetical protein
MEEILKREYERLSAFLNGHQIDLFEHYNKEGEPSDNKHAAYAQGQMYVLKNIERELKKLQNGK